jgi:hypothetical protein
MRCGPTIMTAALLASAVGLVACAGQAPGASGLAPALATVAREGQICRDEYPTGTRIPKRVCRTPEEAAMQMADAETLARRALESGNPQAGR